MQNIIKITIMLLFFFGCSSKDLHIENQSKIDKKVMFNLSSMSIETGYNYISGEQKMGETLSKELQKRADESIYFTRFKKGILKLKIISIDIQETKVRKGSFLFVFPSYEKGYNAKIIYSLTVYSPSGEELQRTEQKVSQSVSKRGEDGEKELLLGALDSFQDSVYRVCKTELAPFATK